VSEYEHEPIRGLPGHLPAGEALLWQGSPDWRSLARRAMHVRAVGGYFGLLIVWSLASSALDGAAMGQALIGTAMKLVVGTIGIGLLLLYAWLVARSTVYTITSKRVVFRFGVALPKCINIPFRMIANAGLAKHDDGTGDIPLALTGPDRIAYLQLWPHARPWHVRAPQPMMRSLGDVDAVAGLLARTLAEAVPGGRRGEIETASPAPAFGGQAAAA
jgi:hypothetical protein